MFCPKCRAEFREGFERCIKCDTDLVQSLPANEISLENQAKKTYGINQILVLDVEKPLKIGSFVYVMVSLLYNILIAVRQFFPVIGFDNNQEAWLITFSLVDSVVKVFMWGLFYYALGQIIGLLKRGFNNEEN